MYRPTSTELKRAQQLTRKLTPNVTAHRRYEDAARFFLGIADHLPFVNYNGLRVRLETIRWQRSVLFRREYLIAHVDDVVLNHVAPDCDAIATATSSIPLVLVPLRRRQSRSELFLSILEHEFVHVNQLLLGAVRRAKPQHTAALAIAAFAGETLIEHQANFIQLATWPRLFPHKFDLTLDHWCVLRGWTAALEAAVVGAHCSPKLMGAFFTRLGQSARSVVRGLGASKAVAAWFEEKHAGLVQSAIELQARRFSKPASNPALLAAATWVTGQG